MAKKATTQGVVREHKLSNQHSGHEHHMCDLVANRQMAKAATLTKGAAYICNICGRGAARAANLCEPVEI